MASHQDWTPVVFHKRTTADIPKQTIIKPKKTNQPTTDINLRKLDDESGENLKIERVSTNLKQQIIKARVAAKLSQAQLAQKINEPVKTVQEYENGSAIPDNRIIQKMSRVLGVVLKKNA